MATYGAQFNPTEAPLPTNWCFEDCDHIDIESLSCQICANPSSRSVLPEMTFTGEQTCPLHTNPHSSGLCSGQVQTFLQGVPYHYRIGQTLHPSRHCQYDNEMTAVYGHPISPVSEYEPNPIKPADDEFSNLHHPTPRDGIHHPTPAYLPPNSFLLSTSSQRSIFTSPESPLSTPFHSPTKQEEEEYMGILEVFTPPLATVVDPIDDFMAQDIDEEEEEEDEEGEEEEDRMSFEGPEKNCPVESRKQLITPELPGDDIDCDKTAPYAVLIHRALMSTPRRRMVLAEIYEYFREKIPRFKKVKGRGWMNSIRHNLSMNGAFLKEDRPPDDPGKGYIWVLSEEAIEGGVKSTTRYRKSPPNSKKRTTDDLFLRAGVSRRRRKSTRKWAAAKSRSRSQSSTIKDEQHEREPAQLPPVPLQYEISTPAPVEALMGYTFGPGESIASENCQTLDYSNCYASFPHFDASSRLYNSDDDDWCFSGPSASNHFHEEYTLVTLDN